MTDIALAYSTEDSKSSSIRPKVDGVLLHLSAIVRRKKDQVYTDSPPPSRHIRAAPYWHFKTTIIGSDDLGLKASVDYVLWYGARGEWDTNLVVVQSSSLLDDECWAALSSMSIVYAARKARKYKGGIYGVCTDSHTWTSATGAVYPSVVWYGMITNRKSSANFTRLSGRLSTSTERESRTRKLGSE